MDGNSSWDSGDDMVLVDVVEISVSFSSKKILVRGSKKLDSRGSKSIEDVILKIKQIYLCWSAVFSLFC